jgi:hypothetical protein
VDCLHQILQSLGGVKGKRQGVLKVFMDQHNLQRGDIHKPWEVMKHEARNCRVGAHAHQPDTVNGTGWSCKCSTKRPFLIS